MYMCVCVYLTQVGLDYGSENGMLNAVTGR